MDSIVVSVEWKMRHFTNNILFNRKLKDIRGMRNVSKVTDHFILLLFKSKHL